MKTKSSFFNGRKAGGAAGLAGLFVLVSLSSAGAASAPFGVPIRLSFKFILNASGNRPASGAINTDAEVEAQVERGNEIFSRWISELRIHNLEIVDLSGVSQWYTAGTDDRDAIRNAAMANPSLYHWRTDAINLYITAANDSAVSDFPPDNNIIVLCQGSHLTTVVHELGHSINLMHTHQGQSAGCTNCGVTCTGSAVAADGCPDTISDSSCWDQNEIAVNNYGQNYANLIAALKYNVDMVWSNLMSYHNVDHRSMISGCQLDRMSTQTYTDRNWLLSKVPVYVDAAASGTQNGSFVDPYQNIQQAINAGVLNGRVLVIDTGTHANPSTVISTRTDVVPRKGSCTIRDAPPLYDLPYVLEESKNPAVRAAVVRAQQRDRQRDVEGVIANLQEAEKAATGREKSALQLELAQRFRDSKRLDEAGAWFVKVAADADQESLRKQALTRADTMVKEAERLRREKTAAQEDETQR